jgi:hypothetical protein
VALAPLLLLLACAPEAKTSAQWQDIYAVAGEAPRERLAFEAARIGCETRLALPRGTAKRLPPRPDVEACMLERGWRYLGQE